ncbi:MAG: prepilin-type cleavage/methylation domain-containing protein, partial [Clostridium sp.]|nr:prepilin-type cleavage/methylation domain-containing protein [Clostridium sp.]
EIDNKYCSDEIICFINEAREDCKSNETSGQIMAYGESNEIKLYNSTTLRDKIVLPNGFYINSNNVVTTDHLIYLDTDGTITTPCTLEYTDRNLQIHDITIGVGTEYVQIHK